MKESPNHPAAGKAGIARLRAIEHHCPGLPEPARSVPSVTGKSLESHLNIQTALSGVEEYCTVER